MSKYVRDLKELAQLLMDEGWPLRSNIASAAAERMERMEKLIVHNQDNLQGNEDELSEGS